MSQRHPLRKVARWINRLMGVFGIRPVQFVRQLISIPGFISDIVTYQRRREDDRFPIRFRNLFPILTDHFEGASSYDAHYFHMDLWMARKIHAAAPSRHVDIGSRIDGFIAHLLTYREVEVVDIRPLPLDIPGLHFIQDDATTLSRFDDGALESVSSLHAAEHFGLGRYGDPIDPQGYQVYMANLSRVLKPGGKLYFAVPCGIERLEYNAHRIFSPLTVLQIFRELKLLSLSGVLDDGSFHAAIDPTLLATQSYGCGVFIFQKPA